MAAGENARPAHRWHNRFRVSQHFGYVFTPPQFRIQPARPASRLKCIRVSVSYPLLGCRDSHRQVRQASSARLPERLHLVERGVLEGAAGGAQRRPRSPESAARISGWPGAARLSPSTPRWRARLTAANSRSPTSSSRRSCGPPAASSACTSASSSSSLASTGPISGQSKPTRAARRCSLALRVSAGRPIGRSARMLGSPPRLLLRALGGLGVLPGDALRRGVLDLGRAEHVRMAADHFVGDPRGDRLEVEAAGLLGHLRVIDHLEQQVAELALEIVENPAARSHRRPRRLPRWCRVRCSQNPARGPRGSRRPDRAGAP